MFRPLRWAASAFVTLILLYVYFFVPVGGVRTLWEHTRRIAGTPEAQELGHDLDRAGRGVATKIRTEVVPVLSRSALPPALDAGRRPRSAAP